MIAKSLGSSTLTQPVTTPLVEQASEAVAGREAAASPRGFLESPDEPETARDRVIKGNLVSASIGTVALSGYQISRLF